MTFLATLDAEIAAQEKILEAHPAYVKLKALRATRALYVQSEASAPSQLAQLFGDVPRPRAAPASGKSLEAVNTVIRILRTHRAPIRTAHLMKMLQEMGITFAGNAPQNILASLLSRTPEVVSKGGHIGWALAEWDSTGGDDLGGNPPPVEGSPEAQGREAGPGGGT